MVARDARRRGIPGSDTARRFAELAEPLTRAVCSRVVGDSIGLA